MQSPPTLFADMMKASAYKLINNNADQLKKDNITPVYMFKCTNTDTFIMLIYYILHSF